MYYVEKRMEISGAHRLDLDYESKCKGLHGHRWIVTVYCKGETLDQNGMLIDFAKIKELIHDQLDHKLLNECVDFNPTAENLARWITERVPLCYKARVEESEGNLVIYEKDLA